MVLNSHDGEVVMFGDEQIAYLKDMISKNNTVRWTMIFMHHPM